LGAEYSYPSAIGALMYLANNTRPDIVFALNCIVRHSVAPTMCHWNCNTPIVKRRDVNQDHAKGFLMKQEYTSTHIQTIN
jgi:hypothetical protein